MLPFFPLTFCLFLPFHPTAAVLYLSLLLELIRPSLNTHAALPFTVTLLLFTFWLFQSQFSHIGSKLAISLSFLLPLTDPSFALLSQAFPERIFILPAFCSAQILRQASPSNQKSRPQHGCLVRPFLVDGRTSAEVLAKYLT
jgi:hypothetical protein